MKQSYKLCISQTTFLTIEARLNFGTMEYFLANMLLLHVLSNEISIKLAECVLDEPVFH